MLAVDPAIRIPTIRIAREPRRLPRPAAGLRPAPVALGMVTTAQGAQIPRLITPAKLTPDDVIDLDGWRVRTVPATGPPSGQTAR